MIKSILRATLVGVTALGLNAAHAGGAADEFWFVRAGPSFVNFHESAEVKLAGQVVPGGNATATNNRALALELGYQFTPELSASLTVGSPPTTTLSGAGTLVGAGKLGEVKYGPAVLIGRYHPVQFGDFRPFVGAGLNYTLIFSSKDAALQNLDVKNASGPVAVVGGDYRLDGNWSLSALYVKIWASADVSFNLPTPGGSIPGTAKAKLNPGIFSAGVTYRF